MLIRIVATGHIEDFAPAFAAYLISSKRGVRVNSENENPGVPIEVAAVSPLHVAVLESPKIYLRANCPLAR